MQMRLCNRCNQLGETADPCTCDIDLVAADHDIAELKKQLAAAEQRAEKAEKDVISAQAEFVEILHNRQAKIEALKTAERNAVRECERIVDTHEGTISGAIDCVSISHKIRNRYPQHFEEE